jgi:hypothetical protein
MNGRERVVVSDAAKQALHDAVDVALAIVKRWAFESAQQERILRG